MESSLMLHVRERMTDIWREKEACKAAAQILACICDGKNYKERVSGLDKATLDLFWKTCKNCEIVQERFPEVYLQQRCSGLESAFTSIIKEMVKKCEPRGTNTNPYYWGDKQAVTDCIERQIEWLYNVDRTRIRDRTVELRNISFSYASENRMQAILVRMRRALKKGSNRDMAVRLLQALASGKNHPFVPLIDELRREPEEYRKLQKFIGAVNRDYYKAGVIRSINRMDVKAQPLTCKTGTDSAHPEGQKLLLNLSNAGREKKAALNDTLLRYASSAEDADQVLLGIKALLFEYFPTNCETEQYLTADRIWKFPHNVGFLFDYGFQPDDNAGSQKIRTLEEMFNNDNPKISQLRAYIRYVNCGKYQQCLRKEDPANPDPFRKYWLGFIEDYVEDYSQKSWVNNKDAWENTAMMASCWKSIIQYLCGKYMDIGKAVYHFAMPENPANKERTPVRPSEAVYGAIRDEFEEGVSSFDYERIKADETLQRDISVAVMAATAAFSGSVVDGEARDGLAAEYENGKNAPQLEDILLISDDNLKRIMKEDAKKQILRFYGGNSTVNPMIWEEPDSEWKLVTEIR